MSASSKRRGYSLLELVISLGTGAILMAGLSSVLYMSTRALTPDVTATAYSSRSSLALSQLTSDLRLAMSFTERTANAVTFTVPDRTGDDAVETIRYAWSGTPGDPLLYQINGSTAATIIGNVQQFNLTSLVRTIAATSCVLTSTIVAHLPHSEGKAATAATSVNIAAPTGLVPGHLMIAAVAVDGSHAGAMTAPAGWTLVNSRADSSGNITTAVWWKIATAAEASNYTFSWTTPKKAYGWITRFSGVKPSAPINAFASTAGTSATSSPAAPTVTTTVANTMIVRIGGFDDDDVTIDSPGVGSHTAITADKSDASNDSASGAAAYRTQAAAGASGTATFALTAAEEFVTFTLALEPDDGL